MRRDNIDRLGDLTFLDLPADPFDRGRSDGPLHAGQTTGSILAPFGSRTDSKGDLA